VVDGSRSAPVGKGGPMGLGALHGVKVIEYCTALGGPYCTKLMANLGAEVIHIEPPRTGDEVRRMPPFLHDVPHPETSGLFLFLNTSKLGITLDPQAPPGKAIFEKLVRDADVLIEDWPADHMGQLGIGYEHLRKINPSLVMVSITPFGRSGPYKDYRAYPLNIAHVAGQGYLHPLPAPDLARAPTRVGGNCTEYDPGQTAAVAVLAALYWKGMTGKGQLIEVSHQESVLSMQKVEAVIFANTGEVATRKGPRTEQVITMMLPCKDGHVVSVTPLEHQWEALMKLVGNAEWSRPPSLSDYQARAAKADATIEHIGNWMRQHTKEEICRRAQQLSCPISAIASAEDVARSEQMNARGFFGEVEHPTAGRIRMPAAPYQFSRTPVALAPAPRLGEHNERIYCERLGYGRDELGALAQAGVI
jgi:CoA:oxalate CoA-transferase